MVTASAKIVLICSGELVLLLSMSFNFPSFLWALLALVIPIIIHLFNFRKTTRIYFSNTKLLRQIKQETTQKRRLKQYLVLASRLLFLFFLVMAFAQPFLPAKESIGSQQNLVIYLDNSFSMSAPMADNTRALDAGVSFVREITERFPSETRYRLITNDFAPSSNSYKNKTEIIDLLAQIRLSPISRSWREIADRVNEKEITFFWISDFQKTTLGSISISDSTWAVRLIPVLTPSLSNVFVDSVYLDNPWITGEKNSIKAILRNSGSRRVEGLVTKLTINNIQAATTALTLEPNSIATATFDLATGLTGLNEAKLSFADFPVSFDNDFYFTLNSTGKRRIVEIKQDAKTTYIEKVFGNRDLFSFRTFSVSNVDYSAFIDADLVVVNALEHIDAGLLSALKELKDKNGLLLIIPAARPDVVSYRALVNVSLQQVANATKMELETPDFRNPFFENVFEDRTAAMALPQATHVLGWGADGSAILKFKNGLPYLSKMANVYLLAAPLDKAYTDFFNNALFVPVMYRMVSFGKTNEQQHYFSLSSTLISVKADSLRGEEPIKLVGSKELVPSQSKVGDRVLLELPRFEVAPGFYKVTNKKDTIDLLAFNLDKNESVLESYQGEEVKALAGGSNQISIFEASTPDTFSKEIKERYLGTPLWKYALVLALSFLLIEVLLIRFLK